LFFLFRRINFKTVCADNSAHIAMAFVEALETSVHNAISLDTEPLAKYATPLGPLYTDENDSYYEDIPTALPSKALPTYCSVSRPEFLYVSAVKPTKESSVGLAFKKREGKMYVFKIRPESLFTHSGLKEGDWVIAVNTMDVTNLSLKSVANVIKDSRSIVSLCAQNEGGDPSTFLSSVQKSHHNQKMGIAFQRHRGAMVMPKVDNNGIFGSSLLVPGHRCLMINGVVCNNLDPHLAADITAASDRVTIISQPRNDIAVILSIEEDDGVVATGPSILYRGSFLPSSAKGSSPLHPDAHLSQRQRGHEASRILRYLGAH
jgi:hypothetical protein